MQAFLQQTPPWVILFTVGVVAAFGLLALAVVYDLIAPRPRRTIDLGDVTVELWFAEGRFPTGADVVVAPVSPDLKMEAGVAKMVRDAAGRAVQAEANRVAPIPPGEAFVATGAQSGPGAVALAVVMDGEKRVRPEWIRRAISQTFAKARSRDAYSVLIPDMTEDLVPQPEILSEAERAQTCRLAAHSVADAIADSPVRPGLVRIWVRNADQERVWREELERRAEAALPYGMAVS